MEFLFSLTDKKPSQELFDYVYRKSQVLLSILLFNHKRINIIKLFISFLQIFTHFASIFKLDFYQNLLINFRLTF